jgi:type IV pilus assembly protein PilO
MKKLDLSKFKEKIQKIIDKIGTLSLLYRVLIFIGIVAVIVGPFVQFLYLPKKRQIDDLKKEYEAVELRLVTAKAKAKQIKHFENKIKRAETEFKMVKKKLPEKKEIPSLLANISQSGQDAGLEFVLFRPKPERIKDFYAEIPVSINVTGNYHHVAVFFDRVSRLPRIVNIDNIKMTPSKGSKLNTSCTAITYRFVEKKPDQASKPKNK